MKKISPQGLFVVCLVVILLIVSWFAIRWHGEVSALQENAGAGAAAISPTQSQAQVQAIVAKVGQLIVLPSDETPTVATVVDPSLLNDQPFFANAQKGDVVLIYTAAKEAILYDPNMNKIVAVAPISIGAGTNADAGSATVPAASVSSSASG